MLTTLLLISCGGDEGLTFDEQLAVDIAAIDRFLENNDIDTEVHSSGIRFTTLEAGDGEVPDIGSLLVIEYDFSALGSDDTLAASIYGESVVLSNNLIAAFSLMLAEMNEGGSRTVYAPSGYCFGDEDVGTLPANSNLKINLKLASDVKEGGQFAADTIIIESYLTKNGINALVDSSGIRYTVNKTGSGPSPELGNIVDVAFEGRFLRGGVFDQSANSTFSLSGLIQAWQIMIPQMEVGEKITIYAPSALCYGTQGNQGIPPNTVLSFDIELLGIR